MKKISLLSILLFATLSTNAQIVLKGYKCKLFEGQPPNLFAEFVSKKDTFHFVLYSRSAYILVPDDDKKKLLAAGLKLCFGNMKYTKTKSGLYVATGRNAQNVFYYLIYIPSDMVGLSFRSARRDSAFAAKSDWLLTQIENNLSKGKDMYFVNEKGQSCQYPDDPNR